jgi:predicted lipid-binding transport protein (Tim44 family)
MSATATEAGALVQEPPDAKDAPDASGSPSVAAHPRAARSVARAKGWGGLAGFAIAGYLSLPTGTLAEAGLRALVAGSVCYVVAWAGAVFVWRRLVVLEIKSREQQLLAAAQLADGRLGSSPAPAERPNARAA